MAGERTVLSGIETTGGALADATAAGRIRRLEKGVNETRKRLGIDDGVKPYEGSIAISDGHRVSELASIRPSIEEAFGKQAYANMYRGYANATRRYAIDLADQARRLRQATWHAETDSGALSAAEKAVTEAEALAARYEGYVANPTREILQKYRPDTTVTDEQMIQFLQLRAKTFRAEADAKKADIEALSKKAKESAAEARKVEDEIYETHGDDLKIQELEAKADEAAERAKEAGENADIAKEKADGKMELAVRDIDDVIQDLAMGDMALAQREAAAFVNVARNNAEHVNRIFIDRVTTLQIRAQRLADNVPRSSADILADVEAADQIVINAKLKLPGAKTKLARLNLDKPGSKEALDAKNVVDELELDIAQNERIAIEGLTAADKARALEGAAEMANFAVATERQNAIMATETSIRLQLIAQGHNDLRVINITAREAARTQVALAEARAEAAYAAEHLQTARAAARAPDAAYPQREALRLAEERVTDTTAAVGRTETDHAQWVTNFQIMGYTIASVVLVPTAVGVAAFHAKEAKAEMRQASTEARIAGDDLEAARKKAELTGEPGDQLAVVVATVKQSLADQRVEVTQRDLAKADLHLAKTEETVAAIKKEEEMQKKTSEAYDTNPEYMAGEAVKDGTLGALHVLEEAAAYVVDGATYPFLGRLSHPTQLGETIGYGHAALAVGEVAMQYGVVEPVSFLADSSVKMYENNTEALDTSGEGDPIRDYQDGVQEKLGELELDQAASKDSQARMAADYEEKRVIENGIVIPDQPGTRIGTGFTEDPTLAAEAEENARMQSVWNQAAGEEENLVCEDFSMTPTPRPSV